MGITCVIFFIFLVIVTNTSEKNYGPYKIVFREIDICKGPKRRDCGEFRLESKQNISNLIFRLDFPKNCTVTTAKVTISSKQKDNTMKKLWNYVLSNPCQHFVLGPILTQSFNLTNTCKINKGNYDIHLNFLEKSSTFLGSNFFYGSYAFKTSSYNRDSNFFCVMSTMDIEMVSPN